jgi:hypothetical protein
MLAAVDRNRRSAAAVSSRTWRERDDDGNITFRGRVRDVIIRGGENIYPDQVESAYRYSPGVAALAVDVLLRPRRARSARSSSSAMSIDCCRSSHRGDCLASCRRTVEAISRNHAGAGAKGDRGVG